MNPTLTADIVSRLLRDYDFKERQNKLEAGICPSCGKRTLWTFSDAPWVVRCNRLNKCASESHVKELYPELFASWSDRYVRSPETPNAAADAYLRDARGFDLARIAGWYVQESYYSHELKIGSATVRFPLAAGAYWERIIDQPERFGDRKATFHGQYGGTWWQPPNLPADAAEIWPVEGIFDAIALLHHGIAAVALLSCVNYPRASLAALAEQCAAAGRARPRLVWALDDDRAGRRYMAQHIERARADGWTVAAALPKQAGKLKLDWNELHLRDRLSPQHVEEYRYLGDLFTAASPSEKARLVYHRGGDAQFPFDYRNRLYWFKLELDAFQRETAAVREAHPNMPDGEVREHAVLRAGVVQMVANCQPTALYYQASPQTDESWYYFRVAFPHDGEPIRATFTSAQIASSSEFKKRLLGVAPGAMYTGTGAQLDGYLARQLARIPTVQTIDYVGYSKEYGCYVYGDVAVKDGRLCRLNDEDFFDIGKLAIKTISQSATLSLNTDVKAMSADWLALLWQAFGAKGLVALAFWFGSLFAEQIRSAHKSYPFLELVGEPGAGKTTLIEFLWKLCGRRDYEGFDPSKSSLAARARNFAQVSNLPVVLIEADRSEEGAKQRGFDWDELKTAYNGRSTRARGVKNGGNETYEPPFRGAIVISQNAEVSASDAVLQRIVHIYCDRSAQTPATRAAAEALERIAIEDVSAFLLAAVMAESRVLEAFNACVSQHEKFLLERPEVKTVRLAKNHAQIMAMVDALRLVLPLTDEQHAAGLAELSRMAAARQQAISADHRHVQQFWEVYDFIESADDDRPILNHSRGACLIAINLQHMAQAAGERRIELPTIEDLKRVLKTSRQRKFVDIRAVNSAINAYYNREHLHAPKRPETVKCWVFESGKRGTKA
ncbi:toprim domain-containing protein [Ralstonia pseudosolanacearum]|uniref:toprim domain-containing protein n=1 Tax=Ralstonia pseudosolanacearum TaxID=1310165 RepID=UPI0007D77D83|nr:toprim domain-containing protein [Ralstonia pseudosolanacearum]MDC6294012.1 toprim domain-containing protein [Ralstonia pseudosolanacearum]MDD7788909.1 toprim domain-containing protein [Ralstonia pseudosolanacearum]MDN3367849.1 toprim domain-containing protein [Ralstonia pseudosolanacearum]OAK90953.1 toprim domain protein [Ralstonia pseudosolanacearum]QOK87764.1 toprim domain-containing protein [Ralstonia pseudosolanacearum]